MIEYTPSAPGLVQTQGRAHFEPGSSTTLGRATLLAPLGGLLGAAVLLASERGAARRAGVVALGASLGLAFARWQYGRALNWQPPYRVELQIGRLELRHYGQEIHAETTIEAASWPETLGEGFQLLSGYLRGNNESGVTLPMTSPVMTTLNAARVGRPRGKAWRPPSITAVDALVGIGTRTMAFVMPGSLTLDELPAPSDERVQLRVVPPRRVAALTFRGRYGSELPAQKRNELLFLVKCAGLTPASEVTFAGYDAPSTLPILRRNEVLVDVSS